MDKMKLINVTEEEYKEIKSFDQEEIKKEEKGENDELQTGQD